VRAGPDGGPSAQPLEAPPDPHRLSGRNPPGADMTATLFSPIQIGGRGFPDRIAVAPMCQ
jgi:hypothetical protein